MEAVTPRLTPTEERVSICVGHGMDYDTISARLGMEPETARVHVCNIAAKLENPDHLKPYILVLLWAAHRRWLMERESEAA